VVLLRNLFEPARNLDLPDPYYGDDVEFDECLEMVRRGSQRLTGEIRRRLAADSSAV
jgi:protein-tyrosine-phosphatase